VNSTPESLGLSSLSFAEALSQKETYYGWIGAMEPPQDPSALGHDDNGCVTFDISQYDTRTPLRAHYPHRSQFGDRPFTLEADKRRIIVNPRSDESRTDHTYFDT
jgi:hypothetical protein